MERKTTLWQADAELWRVVPVSPDRPAAEAPDQTQQFDTEQKAWQALRVNAAERLEKALAARMRAESRLLDAEEEVELAMRTFRWVELMEQRAAGQA